MHLHLLVGLRQLGVATGDSLELAVSQGCQHGRGSDHDRRDVRDPDCGYEDERRSHSSPRPSLATAPPARLAGIFTANFDVALRRHQNLP